MTTPELIAVLQTCATGRISAAKRRAIAEAAERLRYYDGKCIHGTSHAYEKILDGYKNSGKDREVVHFCPRCGQTERTRF